MPMMKQTESFGYTEGEGYQAVKLRYDGGELSMVILVPGAGQFESFEEVLEAERLSFIIESLKNN